MKGVESSVQFLEGYLVAEIIPPDSFVGHSIRELNVRAKYGVDILSIKTKKGKSESVKAIPDPNHIISKDEILVIAGENKNINLIKNLI
jgi:trk system potassium uptake protein TrkA